MGVKYIWNDFEEDTEGKSYSINTRISFVTEGKDIGTKAYQDTYVSQTLMEFHRGDNIEKFINNLAQNPDKAGFYNYGEGNVTRSNKFNM